MNEKTNSGLAVSIGIRYIISVFFTFFVFLSVTVLFTGFFTHDVGYTAYNAQNNEVLYHYYYADGEDIKKTEYEQSGVTVSTVALRSQLEGNAQLANDLTAQLIGGLITVGFVHNILWRQGDSDRNYVNTGHREKDIWRGVKVGLLADIPFAVSYFVLIAAKCGVISDGWFAFYKYMNFPAFSLIGAIFGRTCNSAANITALQTVLGIIPLFVLPIICGICYILGYNRINIGDKILFKKAGKN